MQIELHPFVSYPESMLATTAIHSWDAGFTNFYTQEIHIPDHIIHILADSFASMIDAHYTRYRHEGTPWKVLLLQAESGLLAPLILNKLKILNAPVHEVIQIHMLDSRSALVSAWAELDLIAHHAKKLKIHSLDALSDHWVSEIAPDMVFSDRGLSWIPGRQIQILDGKCYDTVCRTVGFADQSTFQSEYGKIRFIPENGYKPTEVLELQKILTRQRLSAGMFNYVPELYQLITKIILAMPPHGQVTILDYGNTKVDAVKSLESLSFKLGKGQKYTLAFPLIEDLFQKYGWETVIQDLPESSLKLFTASSGETRPLPIQINPIPSTIIDVLNNTSDSSLYLKQLEHYEQQFTSAEDQAYALNYLLACNLLERNLIEKSVEYLKKNITYYGDYAATSLLLLARIRRVYGQYELAELMLKRAEKLMGQHTPLLQEYVQLYLTQHNYDMALETTFKIVQVMGNNSRHNRAIIEQVLTHSFEHPKRTLLEKTLEQL